MKVPPAFRAMRKVEECRAEGCPRGGIRWATGAKRVTVMGQLLRASGSFTSPRDLSISPPMRHMAEDTAPRRRPIFGDAREGRHRRPCPRPTGQMAAKVVLRIEDFGPGRDVDDLESRDAFDLTGLYDGIPLTEKSVMDQPHGARHDLAFPSPDPRRMGGAGNVTLGELVTHVFVHELAHHFGWSDDDIATIDEWWT